MIDLILDTLNEAIGERMKRLEFEGHNDVLTTANETIKPNIKRRASNQRCGAALKFGGSGSLSAPAK